MEAALTVTFPSPWTPDERLSPLLYSGQSKPRLLSLFSPSDDFFLARKLQSTVSFSPFLLVEGFSSYK